MILDALTRFSNAQALTAGTQLSTNAYDLGANRDVGSGLRIKIYVTVNTLFTGGTSLQVNVVEDTSSTLGTATVILSGVPFAEANLTAGKVLLDVGLPKTSKRYLGLQFVTVGTHGAGAVDGNMLFDTDSNNTFPANVGF